MKYDPTNDEYEYDEEVSLEENRERCTARWEYLEKWAEDNWDHSCHAAGAAARAEYLYHRIDDDELLRDADEIREGWVETENLLLDGCHMEAIMDKWIEKGDMTCDWGSYDWMLWAVGYDIPNTVLFVQEWLDTGKGRWYEKGDEIREIMKRICDI